MRRNIIILFCLGFLIACSRSPEKTTRQGYVLGTVCTITAYDASEAVLDDLFDKLKDIEERMRISGAESEIARVNSKAGIAPVDVSSDTAELIRRAIEISAVAPGSFDITIGPLVQLWGIGIKEDPTVPDRTEIEAMLPLIDSSRIQLDGNTVYLPEQGMGIDLGGIAKGYAADMTRQYLLKEGVKSALIDFGGNILTVGRKPDGSMWRIGIQDPSKNRGRYVGVIELDDTAAVTSGPYERFFIEEGIRYHHILNPETGYPAESGVVSVSVITPESVLGDALSTMSYILGLEKIPAVLEEFPDTGIIAITAEKEVFISPRLGSRFTLTDSNYTLRQFPGE